MQTEIKIINRTNGTRSDALCVKLVGAAMSNGNRYVETNHGEIVEIDGKVATVRIKEG